MIRSVAHFIDTEAFGGAERALLDLVRGLDRRLWRQVLFHHDTPGLRPLLDGVSAAGIECLAVEPMRGPAGLVAVGRFARTLRTRRPDVFHAHLNWPLACSGGILAAALTHVPAVVATVQLFSEMPRALTIPIQRWLVTRLVGRYIAVSRAMCRDIEQRLHVPSSRIRAVPNGVALDAFETIQPVGACVRTAMAGRTDLSIVLTFARLDQQKGLRHLLRAAVDVPEAAFVIAGEGPDRTALEAEARLLGVSDRVSFIGFRSDTPALLANADLFVLPSLIEGLPLSVLEAMAAGRPVVATAVPGTDEIVRHGVTGLLVPPADPRALAAAIRQMLSDRALAGRLAHAGRDRVRHEFSSNSTARSVMAVYDELLDGRTGASRKES